MTTESTAAKNQIVRVLRKDGYPTYARLLDMFDVYLTDDPNVVAYMISDKAKVVFNSELSIDQVSTFARHELLHEYLNHGEREKNYNKLHGIKINEITHNLENMAADWEISNKAYTAKDKIIMKNMILGDEVLQGLVTELDRPGWENLTFEEMYEKLLEENEQNKEDLKGLIAKLSKLNQKDLDDMQDDSEEISDEAESQESESEDSKEGKAAKDIKDKADELGKEIDDIKGEVSDSEEKGKDKASNPLDSSSDQKAKEKLADRVAKIKKELRDLQAGTDMLKEVEIKKSKEAAAKKAKKIDTYNQSPMTKFRNDLVRFIRDQIATYRGSSWSKINKTYARSEIIRPGRTSYASGKVPSINVYWDVSGSFNDPGKTAGARAAIALLQQYVREGKLIINVYYFADRVSSTIEGAGGGTDGTPILEHINQTRPTNVIIISDSDIDNAKGYVEVPGAVWMLFYESTAYEFIKHIKGKSETKVYEVTY